MKALQAMVAEAQEEGAIVYYFAGRYFKVTSFGQGLSVLYNFSANRFIWDQLEPY